MSNPKEKILKTVRKHLLEAVPLPDLNQDWITYPDLKAQFAAVLSGVGGQVIHVTTPEMLRESAESLIVSLQAKKVCTSVPNLPVGNVDIDRIEDPHDLEDIDLAILPGEMAIAENAAVWVRGDRVRHRVIYFLPQHLSLVVPISELLPNMHEAYKRLSFGEQGFGVFISGPSKTADIEQSLVIGAHGARSMTVFLTDFSLQ